MKIKLSEESYHQLISLASLCLSILVKKSVTIKFTAKA